MQLFQSETSETGQTGSGLRRFRVALEAIPAGGEGHVWIRLPLLLGEAVMALPSLFTVKAAWERIAEARGVALKFTITGKRVASLFQEAPSEVCSACHVDDDFPPSRSPLQLVRHWAEHRPLAVINYSKSDRLKIAAWLGRVPVRTGVAHGSAKWTYQFSHPFDGRTPGHKVFRYEPLTRWLTGPEEVQRMPRLGTRLLGGESVMDTLREGGWAGEPYVVFGICPQLKDPYRRWFPMDAPWLELAGLARAAGVTPVLVGGPEHRATLEAIAVQGAGLCLAGRTNLPQLAALLANSLGTISVDTGIAHLAAATGRPTVVVFSAGVENSDFPCGEKVVALRGNPVGEPAYPVTSDNMAFSSLTWSRATSTIPAGRAWALLNALASEAPLGPERAGWQEASVGQGFREPLG